MDSHRTWVARHAGRPGDRGTRRAAALDRLARPARHGRADLGSVVRSRVGTRGAAISPASRPPGRRLSPHGPSGSRAQRSGGSAVQGSRIRGERRGTAARAGSRVRGHGAPRDRRVAEGLPAARHRVPPHPDRHAVRPRAAPVDVSFIHPLALLGLAAAAIPALLHLLQRRIPPELDFPPVRYLSAAERESARRLKLRHLLLLILRTALIMVIVLAAARPLVPLRGGGAHQPTAAVIILDNSPSSWAIVDGGLVLDRLRVAARSSLARTTSADRVWLMLCDGVLRGGTREALLATIDSTHPGWLRLDLVRAVERASRMVNAQPLVGREVHVVSDGQRTALASSRATVPSGVRVLALAPGRGAPNRGIAAVTVSEGAAVIELSGSMLGSGGTPQPVPVTLRIGAGRNRGEIAARGLATPGREGTEGATRAAVTVSLPAQSLAPGWWVGEAALEPDELRADDRRPFAWRVAPPARVMATSGAGSFVAAALAVLQEGRRVSEGRDVVISGGEASPAPAGAAVVLPPADAALVGQANRAFASRGVPWHWGQPGTPGSITAPQVPVLEATPVARRYRLVGGGGGASDEVLATVNG